MPGAPSDPVEIIDVRDLAAWLVHLVEQGTTGVFNACGPEKRLAWGTLAWFKIQEKVEKGRNKLAGPSAEKEAKLIAAWREASKASKAKG